MLRFILFLFFIIMYMYERKKLCLIRDDKITVSLLSLFFQTNFKNGTISFNKILFYLTYVPTILFYVCTSNIKLRVMT
jgi:hypothetical protein